MQVTHGVHEENVHPLVYDEMEMLELNVRDHDMLVVHEVETLSAKIVNARQVIFACR